MTRDPDFLYALVPAVYRLRDAQQGYALRALLRVIAEQAIVVEQDIDGLYENWFIETCADWAVPYIGALIGYTRLPGDGAAALAAACGCGGAGGGGGCSGCDGGDGCGHCDCRAGGATFATAPSARREVANTIRYRRRKGTLGVLDEIAAAVGGWPAHAVEARRRLALAQHLDFLHMRRGRLADLRDAPDWRGPAFDRRARTVDVRRIDSTRTPGLANLAEVGVFVWRLRAYPVTQAPAYCYEEEGPNCFLFSALGNDTPLYVNPAAPANAPRLPLPISRDALEQSAGIGSAPDAAQAAPPTPGERAAPPVLYGPEASVMIWTSPLPAPAGAGRSAASRQTPDSTPSSPLGQTPVWTPVDASRIIAADLSDWRYRVPPGRVALDPVLGRIAFAPGDARRQAVRVSYAYAFSTELGGGQYARLLDDAPAGAATYTVGQGGGFARIADALARWRADAPRDAVIEIVDSGVYVEPIAITLQAGQSLQLRAANRQRPVLRLLDWQPSAPDQLDIGGDGPSWFTLDGIIVTGRGLQAGGGLSGVTIRHSTLVPGWGLACDCTAKRPSDPSIVVTGALRCVRIERSIVGAIRVERDAERVAPLRLAIADSIVDALGRERLAIGASDTPCAEVALDLRCSTVIGRVSAHQIDLAADSVFDGIVTTCRRQSGCVRFCYVPPGSRTPRRHACQPDGVERALGERYLAGGLTLAERAALLAAERVRVAPEFASVRYGTPRYGRLADTCAAELRTGAHDGSEMGALHHLQEPQRAARVRLRLSEFTPAQTDAGIVFAS
ncbi:MULTISPECIES: hypothetical protein [Burkholderia]|uniref:hypothetical protein n=1 Tax=Burkholderia TaxID=32008 RepID=UPI00084150A5|nr:MULTISPECIES: hypothetical protein [unclassified Burkholderia]AOK29758.1 hypothetical protein AQ611_10305 [Burkholderia sp. Bp7605]